MKNYDYEFHSEISKIMEDLYKIPDMNKIGGIKRKKFSTQKKFIDYLVNNEFVKIVGSPTLDGEYYLQLELKGFEVFEKYEGWENYKKQVIDYESKIQKAQKLAITYWWIPIAISILALCISVFALFF